MERNMKLPDNRLENKFSESKPLYTKSEARIEANRCLFCYDALCTVACPAGIDISTFINKIASGNIRGAAKTIFKKNLLGVTTAQVCPVEELCVGACVYNKYNSNPINIGRLQRYATETAIQWEQEQDKKLFNTKVSSDRKVALIGAGPASLSCAAHLAHEGVKSVIYEKDNLPGGLNVTGIAPYKLFSDAALKEIDWLKETGLEIQTGVDIGHDISIDNLIDNFDAVFLGAGLGKDKFPGIPGENTSGVWGATDLIRKIKNDHTFTLPENLKTVNVVGGGNSAIDIARELAILGVLEVNIIYRQTKAEMPGYQHELDAAQKDGVRMIEYAVPVEIIQNNRLVLYTKHKITGEPQQFESDWIVIAIGNERDAGQLIPGLEIDEKGCVIVDSQTKRTSVAKIYAGGDCINGGKEVVNAVADGRDAAFAMLHEWGMLDLQHERKNHG
ncbi:MAG: FAD-dependent oxidoreductase [Candidatus Marinimicrobia bacterium]|nr:FAD-dependent oxidoreductase [Candidatus Neomarinimicrobiota bacterium]